MKQETEDRKKDAAQGKNPGIWVARYGLLLSLAIVFGYVEMLIPIHLGVPGAKLGLANLVTMVGLYTIGIPGTIIINLARIFLINAFFGNMFSMVYSMAGAALSLFLMAVLKKTGWFTQVGVSIIGGVGHNIGQLIVAAFVVKTMGVFSYLPFLFLAGTAAGGIIGLLGGMVVQRIRI